jgi:hypothetical protein
MKFRTAMVSTLAAGLALAAASQASAQQAAEGTALAWGQGNWARGLPTGGLAPGFWDRVEISVGSANPAVPPAAFGGAVPMSVLGLKVRVAGNAMPGNDSWLPQIAVGLQQRSLYPASAGPAWHLPTGRTSSTDFYVSASKLLPAQGVLLNATVRARPNSPTALGAAGRDSYSLRPELSVAFLLSRNLAIGAEYRFKPGNGDAARGMGLGDGLRDEDAKDLYIAWAPHKNLSLTLAYVGQDRTMPGLTVNRRPARSYFSAELSF